MCNTLFNQKVCRSRITCLTTPGDSRLQTSSTVQIDSGSLLLLATLYMGFGSKLKTMGPQTYSDLAIAAILVFHKMNHMHLSSIVLSPMSCCLRAVPGEPQMGRHVFFPNQKYQGFSSFSLLKKDIIWCIHT